MPFENRREAGMKLAERLRSIPFRNPIVLALPRGGVPIGFEIAKALHAPLDVLVARKIGSPTNLEYGIGAITEGGYYWIDEEAAAATGVDSGEIEKVVADEYRELLRRIDAYRDGDPLPSLAGRSVIVADDGLATGVTARVACHYLKERGVREVVLAVPVGSPRVAARIRDEVDRFVCLEEPEYFRAVGQFYEDFGQTTDAEVLALLREAKELRKRDRSAPRAKAPAGAPIGPREVLIEGEGVSLAGELAVPAGARGLVIFAHGSGSGRMSPRNRRVGETLNAAGLGTLLFDLLTPEEAADRTNVFDIPLLASRLVLATRWVRKRSPMKDLPIGYFGASTGGGAALWAAAELKDEISAVVSRGGRPDLADLRLPEVKAPTLLLVGGLDETVVDLNAAAAKRLPNATLTIIPGASHLFEEEGKLEEVAEEAKNWFGHHLRAADAGRAAETPRPGLKRDLDPVAAALRPRARRLGEPKDLAPLVEEIARAKIIMLGESSHGTAEFYEWRRIISEWLVVRHGFDFIAVEGDWPPCFALDRYARGEGPDGARSVLREFRRWPTWMWGNEEVARLAEWMRSHNRVAAKPVDFYGLDVYSLFESIDVALAQFAKVDRRLAAEARARYACFEPFRRDERAYARSLIGAPEGCREEANAMLREALRMRLYAGRDRGEALFDATQNARIVANAERYYRTMIEMNEDSWNVRDRHMLETLETLLERRGPDAKAIVWAHNTHIGDHRATDMLARGQVNIGGLAREKWGEENVALVGFGTHRGTVVASHAWDGPIERMTVPEGRPGSLEHSLHSVANELDAEAFFVSLRDPALRRGALARTIGHRAIGVVYDPAHERYGNYVPTSFANRYDAFVFVDETHALNPLGLDFDAREIPETWPQGM